MPPDEHFAALDAGQRGQSMIYAHALRYHLIGAVAVIASGCEEGTTFAGFGAPVEPAGGAIFAPRGPQPAMVERDVEAPQVFEAHEAALWDGRPSLGGIWVAHPDVDEPERVIIRNLDNGKFVVGALFRRERQNPGPLLQVSSDAAAELQMLAGAPTELSVVALIRETVPIEPVAVVAIDPVPGLIEETTLEPVASIAAAAIDAAVTSSVKPVPRPDMSATATQGSVSDVAATPTPTPRPQTTNAALEKPFVQVGIFSVEANADQAAELLRNSGIIPTMKTFETNGKPFWRLLIGPVTDTAERDAVMAKIRGLGFADAYAVTN